MNKDSTLRFEITVLHRLTVVDDVNITTLIKPPASYLSKLHPTYLLSNMYPEEAVVFAEAEDSEEEPEILSIDEDQLVGYNILVSRVIKSPKTFCLALVTDSFAFPIAYSKCKEELVSYMDSLDINTVHTRVVLMCHSDKFCSFKYPDLKTLSRQYLRDPEFEKLERDVLRDFKDDMQQIKQENIGEGNE